MNTQEDLLKAYEEIATSKGRAGSDAKLTFDAVAAKIAGDLKWSSGKHSLPEETRSRIHGQARFKVTYEMSVSDPKPVSLDVFYVIRGDQLTEWEVSIAGQDRWFAVAYGQNSVHDHDKLNDEKAKLVKAVYEYLELLVKEAALNA